MGRTTVQLMEGGAIVLEVVLATSRSRIAHVGEFTHVFMNAEVGQLCWDC